MSKDLQPIRHSNRATTERKVLKKQKTSPVSNSTYNMNLFREEISEFVDIFDRQWWDFLVDRRTDSLEMTVMIQVGSKNIQWYISHSTRNNEWSGNDHCGEWTLFHLSRESHLLDWEDRWDLILLLQQGLFLMDFSLWRLTVDCCMYQQHKHLTRR